MFSSLLGLDGQITVLFRHTVISQGGKELILVRGSHSEGEDSRYSFKRRRTADSDNCSGKSKQPDDDRVEVNAPVDEELLESSENKKTNNVPGFDDFHKEVPGVKLSESNMEWWLRHRSKLIKKDKFEELVNQYAFDHSIAFLVEPPKAPETLVAQTKKRDQGRVNQF